MRTPTVDLNKDMVIKFGENAYEIVYINDYGYDKKYTEIITELVKKWKLFHLQKVFKLSKMRFSARISTSADVAQGSAFGNRDFLKKIE